MTNRLSMMCVAMLSAFAWLMPMRAVGAAGEPREPTPSAEHDPNQKGGVDLRPKFVEGREARYTMRSTSKSTSEPVKKGRDAKPSTKNELEQEIGLLVRTTKVNEDGSAELQVVYESLKIKGRGEGYELDFDSTKSKKPSDGSLEDQIVDGVIDSLLRGIVGTTLDLNVDASGTITSVTGGGALGALANSPFESDADLSGLLNQAPGGGQNNGLDWIIGSSSSGDAAHRRVGEQWANHDKLAGGGTPIGSFDMLTTHTLKRVRGRTAEVAFVSVLESAASRGNAGAKSGQLDKARADGTYRWDTELGELDEMTSTQTSTITVGEGEEAARLTSEQKVRVERKGH